MAAVPAVILSPSSQSVAETEDPRLFQCDYSVMLPLTQPATDSNTNGTETAQLFSLSDSSVEVPKAGGSRTQVTAGFPPISSAKPVSVQVIAEMFGSS
ncbi:hypothetical protein BaRGS_00001908 [Batillaria attramentaria]|uniref:Uncharacterized protein n=1 Tax=Batillaria attramentaria TaxID=370345 RepID=A0ABD0M6X7_9CAEN